MFLYDYLLLIVVVYIHLGKAHSSYTTYSILSVILPLALICSPPKHQEWEKGLYKRG